MNAANVLLRPPVISDGAAGTGWFTARSAPPRLALHSDAALVRLAQAGDDEALDVLLRRHRSVLLSHARRLCGSCALMEDLCQESCLNLMSRLSDLRKPEALAGWMHTFLANATRNCRRKNCKKVGTPAPGADPCNVEDLSVEATWVDHADWESLWKVLWKAANGMDGRSRKAAAFMLEFYDEHGEFPGVRLLAEATHSSHGAAERGRTAVLRRWQRTLTALKLYP